VVTEWQIPTADSAPTGIVAGSDGKLYFTEQSAKQLGQLDPASGAIRESAVPDGGIPLAIVALPDGPPSPAAARHPHANGTKSGVVFNALPSNLRDGRAIWAVIDPGDLNPDPKAFVFLIENPLFGPDLDNSYETFRIGSVFFLVLQVENVSATAPTFGPIEMQSRLPDFVTEAVGGFFNAPGTCKEENRVVTCTTPKVLESGESVTALVTFQVPRPPAGAEMFSFEIFNSIKGGSDVNENNNFAGHTVYFRVDRDGGVLEKLPEIIALAIRSGRP
jgi:hypothetical protein